MRRAGLPGSGLSAGTPIRAAALISAALSGVTPAFADLLGPRTGLRELPFELRDGKPVIAARVGDIAGFMMFDTGTPDAVFLNRDALRLDDGTHLATGRAASGQRIEVRAHDAPAIRLAGEEAPVGPTVRSGDFGFTHEILGADFLGFIGRPAVEDSAFVLDYGRRVLTILATGPDGAPRVPGPAPEEVAVRIDFVLDGSGLPRSSARIGGHALTLDLDTGDGGTLYLRDDMLARLVADGAISVDGEHARIAEVALGDASVFRDLPVRLVRAGGPADARPAPETDLLRLGAGFFALHVTLWNYPRGTLDILRPGASYP